LQDEVIEIGFVQEMDQARGNPDLAENAYCIFGITFILGQKSS